MSSQDDIVSKNDRIVSSRRAETFKAIIADPKTIERSIQMLMRTRSITSVGHALANARYAMTQEYFETTHDSLSSSVPLPTISASQPMREADAWIKNNQRRPLIIVKPGARAATRDLDVIVDAADCNHCGQPVFRTRILACEPLPEFIGASPAGLAAKLALLKLGQLKAKDNNTLVFDVGDYLKGLSEHYSSKDVVAVTSTISDLIKGRVAKIAKTAEGISSPAMVELKIGSMTTRVPVDRIPRDIDLRTLIVGSSEDALDMGIFLQGKRNNISIRFGSANESKLIDRTGRVGTLDKLASVYRNKRFPFLDDVRRLMWHGKTHRALASRALRRTLRVKTTWAKTRRSKISAEITTGAEYKVRAFYPNIGREPSMPVRLAERVSSTPNEDEEEEGKFVTAPGEGMFSVSGPSGSIAPLQARKMLSSLLKSPSLGALFHDFMLAVGYNSERDSAASEMLATAVSVVKALVIDANVSSATVDKSRRIRDALFTFVAYFAVRVQIALPHMLIDPPHATEDDGDTDRLQYVRGYPIDDDTRRQNGGIIQMCVVAINAVANKRGIPLTATASDIEHAVRDVLSHLPAMANGLQRTRTILKVLDSGIVNSRPTVRRTLAEQSSGIVETMEHVVPKRSNLFVMNPGYEDNRWVFSTVSTELIQYDLASMDSSVKCKGSRDSDGRLIDLMSETEEKAIISGTGRLVKVFNDLEKAIAINPRSRLQALVDVVADLVVERNVGKMIRNDRESLDILGTIHELSKGGIVGNIDSVAATVGVDVTRIEILVLWQMSYSIAWLSDKLRIKTDALVENIFSDMLTSSLLYDPEHVAQVRADLRESIKQSQIRKLDSLDDSMRATLMNVRNHVPEDLLDIYDT